MVAKKNTKVTFEAGTHASLLQKGNDQVPLLIEVGLATAGSGGRVQWDKIEDAIPGLEIGYSRGWCIVRRAWLEQNAPGLLCDGRIAEVRKAEMTAKGSEFNENQHVLGPIVRELREQDLSWGEIAVRCNVPESKVRAAFKTKAGMHDKGLRIGKGGRYVADRGDLYVENMQKEGVKVDGTLPRSTFRTMDRTSALNYVAPEPVKPVRKPRTPKKAVA